MERENLGQIELFSGASGQTPAKRRAPVDFLSFIFGYEKVILIIIGFMITGIICFSLGIERGKRITSADRQNVLLESPLPAAQETTSQGQIKPAVQIQATPKPKKKDAGNFIIQVASYQSNASAEKEAELLKQKGFSPQIKPSGKYTVLCVGSFSSKETAKSALSQLKSRYRDCFIRRL